MKNKIIIINPEDDENNLVDGDSFSFIAYDGNKLLFSKNTIDSQITEYSLLTPEVQSNVSDTNDSKELDVQKVEVPESEFYGEFKEKEDQEKDQPVKKDSLVFNNKGLKEEKKTDFLDSHTVVSDESKRSRFLLIGFYILLVILVGISIYLILTR